ncbi:MAG: hypothetical protein Q9200_006693 [Gallowayella weberi]
MYAEAAMSPLSCPFCPFSDRSPYFLAQHVETIHPETDQPSVVPREFLEENHSEGRQEAATVQDVPSQYIDCECGEAILVNEFEDHATMHTAESADTAADMAEIIGGARLPASDHTNAGGSTPKADHALPLKPSRHHRGQSAAKDWVACLLGPDASRKKDKIAKHKNAKRLGKDELGPYAHEDQMPAWLHRQLERGAKVSIVNEISREGHVVQLETVANEIRGVLPVLAQLCEQDNMLAKAYLCHPGVQHVFKMAKEGGFCGYRNIQMMVGTFLAVLMSRSYVSHIKISFIQATQSPGHEYFPARVPSVLDLQELIEGAWDRGINTVGRVETGGIRGTRKYIGTPEVRSVRQGV